MEEFRRRERGGENQTRENMKGACENEWRIVHRWIIVATVNAMKQPWTWIVSQTHAQNTIHSWYLLFSLCPMMSLVQKKQTNNKTTATTTTTKQKGKGKPGVKAKYSQFLFLRHIFVWHPSASLHIWLSGNKSTTAITLLHRLYHNYTFLTANKSFCTLS